jgi:hypothetical protein
MCTIPTTYFPQLPVTFDDRSPSSRWCKRNIFSWYPRDRRPDPGIHSSSSLEGRKDEENASRTTAVKSIWRSNFPSILRQHFSLIGRHIVISLHSSHLIWTSLREAVISHLRNRGIVGSIPFKHQHRVFASTIARHPCHQGK